jgi:hypothetical protein
MSDVGHLLELHTLKEAMKNKGYDDKKIEQYSNMLMNLFGYSDTLLDNRLNCRERDIFYKMEDDGIVKQDRKEEVLIPYSYEGLSLKPSKAKRKWKIFHWILRVDDVKKLAQPKTKDNGSLSEEERLYGELSQDVWKKAGEVGEHT